MPKKSTIRTYFYLLAKIAVALSLVLFVLSRTDKRELIAMISRFDTFSLLLSFLFNLLGVLISAITWYSIIKPKSDISISKLLLFYLESEFVNLISPGTLFGDTGRVIRIKNNSPINTFNSSMVVIAEKLLYIEAFAYLSAFGIVLSYFPTVFEVMGGMAFALFIFLRIALLSIGDKPSNYLKDHNTLVSICDSIEFWSKNTAKSLPIAICLSITVVLSAYPLIYDVAPTISIWQAIGFVPLIAILSSIPISIRGLGLREAGYATAMVALGASQEAAVAVGLASFGITIAVGLVGGITIFFKPKYSPNTID